MKDFWASYYIPTSALPRFELHSPWWISGYTMGQPEEATVVMAIRAENEGAVSLRVHGAFDHTPEFRERFINRIEDQGWSPFTDRFPRAEWMEWNRDATCGCGLSSCDGGRNED